MLRLYCDWYVLCVTIGKENLLKSEIQKYVPQSVRMVVFQREIIISKKGKKNKIKRPLFSGYIFVHKDIMSVYDIAKRYFPDEFIHPVSVNGKPNQVDEDEMRMLLQAADMTGTFQLSYGLKIGDEIKITDGPLKTLPGNVYWINEKKCKVKVELNMFNRKMKVNLGIKIVSQRT